MANIHSLSLGRPVQSKAKQYRRKKKVLFEGPRRPFNCQDPHWCSGEVQHSTQTHPRDEELGCLHDYGKYCSAVAEVKTNVIKF